LNYGETQARHSILPTRLKATPLAACSGWNDEFAWYGLAQRAG